MINQDVKTMCKVRNFSRVTMSCIDGGSEYAINRCSTNVDYADNFKTVIWTVKLNILRAFSFQHLAITILRKFS